jgi:hypothetical protein
MQRVLGFCLLSLAAAAYSHAQATPSAHHTGKSTAASYAAASKSKKKITGDKATAKRRTLAARGRRARPKPAPTYQLHPDPERYQQIQQALADRGYFKGQVNGEWNDDSVDALKRFQTDQKIDNDGKINALSLIGLGLGPKHDGSTGHNAPLPAPAPDSPVAGAPEAPSAETQTPPAAPPN